MRTRILGTSWRRVLVGSLALALVLFASGTRAVHTAHAQAGQTATDRHVVDYQQVVATQRSGPTRLNGGGPDGPIVGCIGGSVLASTNGIAGWKASGKAWNNCAVDMRQASLYIDAYEYCPLGNSVVYATIYLTPPNWPAGSVYAWSANGVAFCYVCSEGLVVDAPPYSESIAIWLSATDIVGRNYLSASPNPTAGPFSMQNLPLKSPC